MLCLSIANSPVAVVDLQSRINSTKYVDMLSEYFRINFERNIGNNLIFMQGNAPIHTAWQ